jgi:uncharacterized protein involved in cysteine biosynthesis
LIRSNSSHPSNSELRKFGYVFTGVFSILSAVTYFRGSPRWDLPAIAAILIFLAALFAVKSLKHVYAAWMKFGSFLGWMNTRLLLGVIYYFIITPIAVIVRLAGTNLLDEKIDKSSSTYWKHRDRHGEAKDMERQF